MVSGMFGVSAYTFQTADMMFSYIIGIQDPFRCDVFSFFLFPFIVNVYTFVMLSVDKFIAIKFALRYKAIITYRRAYQAITAVWVLSFIRLMLEFISPGAEYNKSSQLGACSIEPHWITIDLVTLIIPILFACCITITLDVYLSIKAYQLYIKSQGDNEEGL